METVDIITYLILPAIAGLYLQQYRTHGCLKKLEGKVNAEHKKD